MNPVSISTEQAETMRKDQLLTCEQMERLTTERLLAYKNRLYKVRERGHYDYGNKPGDLFVTKDSLEWQATVAAAKSILATREHVAKESR